MIVRSFRKKPVVVEAAQTQALPIDSHIVDWVLANGGTARWHDDGRIAIDTLEGTMFAEPGDWIVRGTEGEFYPCKPAPFAATFEEVA